MQPKAWMDYMFDHTFIVAEDDPFKESFMQMNNAEVNGQQKEHTVDFFTGMVLVSK